MSTLTGNTIASTYISLLKTADNTAIDASSKNITDGSGNATALSISSADVTVDGTLIVSGSIVLADNIVTFITASQALTASYIDGMDPVIGISGSTIYSIQPSTTNFSTTEGIFIGDGAGTDAVDANSSIFIGAATGQSASQADNSVFIGNAAGAYATDSDYAVFIGAQTGNGATNADNSVFIGIGAGQTALAANNSVFIGNAAGQDATNASYSTLIGYQAGILGNGATGIGTNNIIIGTNITLADDTVNTANIGGALFISGTYSDPNSAPFSGSVEGVMVGIGTSTPTATLDISGSLNVTSGSITLPGLLLLDFADDTAAQAGGVQVGGLYRNGNVVSIRVS